MTHNDLVELLRDTELYSGHFFENFAGVLIGAGILLTPGLLIGFAITRSRILAMVTLFFMVALLIGILTQQLLAESQKKQFVKLACAKGASAKDAEQFFESVDWDEVFPEAENTEREKC